MSAVSRFPKAEIIERYLQEDLEDCAASWMSERGVIPAVANYFSRLRWLAESSAFRVHVDLAMRGWVRDPEDSPRFLKTMIELLSQSLQKFPKDKLILEKKDE